MLVCPPSENACLACLGHTAGAALIGLACLVPGHQARISNTVPVCHPATPRSGSNQYEIDVSYVSFSFFFSFFFQRPRVTSTNSCLQLHVFHVCSGSTAGTAVIGAGDHVTRASARIISVCPATPPALGPNTLKLLTRMFVRLAFPQRPWKNIHPAVDFMYRYWRGPDT